MTSPRPPHIRLARLLFGVVALMLIATACFGAEGSPGGIESSQTTTVVEVPTTEAPPVEAPDDGGSDSAEADTPMPTEPTITLTVTDCGNETDEFELFCEAYDILTSNFVDELDPADLAAGAIEGMEAYAGDAVATVPDAISCAAPNVDFRDFCSIFAQERLEEIPGDALVEAAVQGLMNFGIADANSNYLPPADFEAFRSNTSGQIEGIGALVRGTNTAAETDEDVLCNELSETCKLEIVAPLDGSPAEAGGILPGDYIVAVNGEDVEGQLVDAVVLQVRGPAGSEVLLGIERDGEVFDVTIVRAPIVIPIVTSEMLNDTVGYLSLAQFTATSPDLVREALGDLIDSGAETIVFDLQNNPGGLLDASVEIASEFIDDGLILSTQAPDQTIEFPATGGGIATDESIEVFVLINRGSASASEVVAGALQDTGRATIVGENSFGKNTVQRQFLLSNGGALKVTISRWVTPDGNDFGIVGLTPDVPVDIDGQPGQFLIDFTLDLIETG